MSIGKHAFNLSVSWSHKVCFIRIEFNFASRHPFFDILKASVQLIKSGWINKG